MTTAAALLANRQWQHTRLVAYAASAVCGMIEAAQSDLAAGWHTSLEIALQTAAWQIAEEIHGGGMSCGDAMDRLTLLVASHLHLLRRAGSDPVDITDAVTAATEGE